MSSQEREKKVIEEQYSVEEINYRAFLSYLREFGKELNKCTITPFGESRKFSYFGAKVGVTYKEQSPDASPQLKLRVSSNKRETSKRIHNGLVGILRNGLPPDGRAESISVA